MAQQSTDFDVSAVLEWVSSLHEEEPSRVAPVLLMRLEQLAREEMDVERRFALLRVLKRPLTHVAEGLSRDDVLATGRGSRDVAQTPVQRLYAAMIRNLRRLLESLDKSYLGNEPEVMAQKDWALRNLFKFAARQAHYAIAKGLDWPDGFWLELHEVFHYLVRRGEVAPNQRLRLVGKGASCDAELSYLQLLLLGLSVRIVGRGVITDELRANLKRWAVLSRLDLPETKVGAFSLFLIEIERDAPPRFKPGNLIDSFHGWVLTTPPELLEYLNRLKGSAVLLGGGDMGWTAV